MKKIKNGKLLFSILIMMVFTGFFLYHFYPENGIVGMQFVITILARYAFLILGTILFVFRVSGFLRRENFLYIFLGAANIWLGFFWYFLYFLHKVDEVVILAFLPNLLLGILLLVDVYWARTKRI